MALSKKQMLSGILLAVILFVFVGYLIPTKTAIDQNLPCTDMKTGAVINVTVSGTYYAYLLRDDVFDGKIDIEGKCSYTQKFELQDDLYTNFNDAYGQPKGHILQFKKFSYISIANEGYSISSQWDESWNEAYRKKAKRKVVL